MCFTFKKKNKQTKKPVNRFLQDDASAGIRSLQTSIEIKLPKSMERTLDTNCCIVFVRRLSYIINLSVVYVYVHLTNTVFVMFILC